MAFLRTSCLAVLLFAAQTSAIANCPFNGAVFPKPTDFSSATWQAAVASLASTFQARDSDPATNPDTTSYALEIFSSAEDQPIWSHYHSSAELRASNGSAGVKAIDSNSVFRIGSVTKIFTVLTFLVKAGHAHWDDPVTAYVPELAVLARNYYQDPILHVDWDSITLGALASQLTGIVRDYGINGELTQALDANTIKSLGFPPVSWLEIPRCGEYPVCNRQQIFEGLSKVPPSVAPFSTATYSDLNFVILSMALEAITGKPYKHMLMDDVVTKLGLNHTYYSPPPTSLGPQPSGCNTGWTFDMGVESPTGNMFSSTGDLSTLGRAIFRNSLLKPRDTRRWFKPASFTSELVAGVGYPWGVRRIPLSSFTSSGSGGHRVVDTYNKAGGIGTYSALLVMIPDYEVGLVILTAGSAIPGNHNWNMADAVGGTLLPALEAIAREQAQSTYSGIYDNAAVGSSLTLTTDANKPGLGVSSWISNGTDMVYWGAHLQLGYNVTSPSVRLYPTGLETTNSDGSRRIAWKAIFEDMSAPSRAGAMFSTDCGTWVSQTGAVYANKPLDQFVFHMDKSGKVTGVESLALRVTLTKSRWTY